MDSYFTSDLVYNSYLPCPSDPTKVNLLKLFPDFSTEMLVNFPVLFDAGFTAVVGCVASAADLAVAGKANLVKRMHLAKESSLSIYKIESTLQTDSQPSGDHLALTS